MPLRVGEQNTAMHQWYVFASEHKTFDAFPDDDIMMLGFVECAHDARGAVESFKALYDRAERYKGFAAAKLEHVTFFEEVEE